MSELKMVLLPPTVAKAVKELVDRWEKERTCEFVNCYEAMQIGAKLEGTLIHLIDMHRSLSAARALLAVRESLSPLLGVVRAAEAELGYELHPKYEGEHWTVLHYKMIEHAKALVVEMEMDAFAGAPANATNH